MNRGGTQGPPVGGLADELCESGFGWGVRRSDY